MKAVRLKTEYLSEPVGVDFKNTRLMWNCEGGIRQSAYEITAFDDSENVLWQSGKVSSSSMHAVWNGSPVKPKTKVIWKIRLFDENDIPGDFTCASFETGIDSFKAKWITGNYIVRRNRRYPVDCFRKRFYTSGIVKARLYISACGVFEARINGEKCGDYVMAPGYTDYRKRVQYLTYDVTELITTGENELTVFLADGWYRGSCGAWGLRNRYGTVTKLLCQLELYLYSGEVQTIVSDESWEFSNDGPIRFADNKDGEIVSAAMSPSYSGKAKLTTHRVTPAASDNVKVTEHEYLTAKKITTPSGKTVLDFGENIAGYIAFSLNAHEGDRIKLLFGEMLDSNNEFTQANFQLKTKRKTTPMQQIIYTCREGKNEYKTTFSVFGFQYVLVEADFEINAADFTAIAVYSDMEETGKFECSSVLINKFFDATLRSAKGNHLDIPTDCPTRERHGWTGDAQIFCSTACFLFDYYSFADKYLRDLYDWQKKSGKLPQIVPEGGTDFYMRGMNGSAGWADAGVIIPYTLWKQYDDERILLKYIDGMRKYAAFMQRRCGKWYPTAKRTGLRGIEKKYLSNCGQAYGEWAEPSDVHIMTWKDCAVPHPETATAYTIYIMDLMTEVETRLNEPEKAKAYAEFALKCRKSYQALRKTGLYPLDTDRQARLVRPLYFKLLSSEDTGYAKKRLIKALENYKWRLGTGFLSTPFILYVLAEIDINAAYRLLENEEIPGWLAMPKQGASTVWENWDGPYNTQGAGAGSLNHYSKGSVCRFLFDTVCGIHLDGENRFLITPRPGGNLSYAFASYDSVYGKVISAWEKTEEGYVYRISVPGNCTAIIRLPGGKEVKTEAGEICLKDIN